MYIKMILLFLVCLVVWMPAFAGMTEEPTMTQQTVSEAPVVVAEQYNEPESSQGITSESVSSDSSISPESLTNAQRLARLEQQIANQAVYTAQIENLQHQVQDLQGRLDEANHQIQVLQQSSNKKIADNTPQPTKITQDAVKEKDPANVSLPTESIATNPNNLLQEQDIYEKAYRLIEKKDYTQAISSMKSYVEQFPRGQYAGNAHYWLGELYVLQHSPDNARTEFKMVIDKFPNNSKVQLATKRLREIDVKSHAKH